MGKCIWVIHPHTLAHTPPSFEGQCLKVTLFITKNVKHRVDELSSVMCVIRRPWWQWLCTTVYEYVSYHIITGWYGRHGSLTYQHVPAGYEICSMDDRLSVIGCTLLFWFLVGWTIISLSPFTNSCKHTAT